MNIVARHSPITTYLFAFGKGGWFVVPYDQIAYSTLLYDSTNHPSTRPLCHPFFTLGLPPRYRTISLMQFRPVINQRKWHNPLIWSKSFARSKNLVLFRILYCRCQHPDTSPKHRRRHRSCMHVLLKSLPPFPLSIAYDSAVPLVP